MPKKIPTAAKRQFNFKPAETKERIADRAFYSAARWRKTRAAHLKKNPICARCKENGFINADRLQVHHVIDRKERPDLAYDRSNLITYCINCHSSETGKRNQQKRFGS